MKRLLYLSSVLALVVSFGIVGGRSYAAHQSARVIDVRLCTSVPLGVPSLHLQAQGINLGTILATEQSRRKFRAAGLTLLSPLTQDDARADGVSYDQNHERANALRCVNSPDTFGYVGTLNSGAAQVSEPILNRAGMVQISPANSGTVLTDPRSRASQEPLTYRHKLRYLTYYRTVTTDALQGPSDAAFLRFTLRASSYFLVDDKLTYGAGLAQAMGAYAPRIGLRRLGFSHIDPTDSSTIATTSDAVSSNIVSKRPGGVLYGGDPETGFLLAKDLRRKGYRGPIVGGDGIVTQTYISGAKKGAQNVYATSFGPAPTATAKSFQRAYRSRFHHAPLANYDATAYDAANIELNAIYKAFKAGKMRGGMFKMRKAVLPYVASVSWPGAIGVTRFDRNGDTFNRILSVFAARGTWRFFALAPRITGINPTG